MPNFFSKKLSRAISPGRRKDPEQERLKEQLKAEAAAEALLPPPPPLSHLVDWEDDGNGKNKVYYVVRDPWEWVMNEISEAVDNTMIQVDKASELPTSTIANENGTAAAAVATSISTPGTRRSRRAARAPQNIPSTLRMEITTTAPASATDSSVPKKQEIPKVAIHGTSCAFDGLEDKDELFRTLQRCKCEHLNLTPPTVLVGWDVSEGECVNIVGKQMPVLPSNTSKVKYAVLKEPMGSRGTGIFFVKDAKEIHTIISEHKKRVSEQPEFLDNLIQVKGRIPSWVLQAEINPCYLLENKYKFHIRSYVVAVEREIHDRNELVQNQNDLVDIYFFNRHEVRIAKTAVDTTNEDDEREVSAHITNGSLSRTDRGEELLLEKIPELVQNKTQEKIELFLSKIFGFHLVSDMSRRVVASINQDIATIENAIAAAGDDNAAATAAIVNAAVVRKFAIAGVDLMLSADGQIFLLEVNVNPNAPPKELVDDVFKAHLTGFMRNLMDLITGKSAENFISTKKYLIDEEINNHVKTTNAAR